MQAPILYFVPGASTLPDLLAARFVDEAGKPRSSIARNSNGPGTEKRGLLASPFAGVACVFDPTAQRWDRFGEYSIGARRDAKPSEFAREHVRAGVGRLGKPVRMADGNDWIVPIANPFVRTCSLPTYSKLAEDGVSWVRELTERHAALGETVGALAAQMRDGVLRGVEKISIDDDELRLVVARALAVNYDVTIPELSALRVFSDEAVQAAIAVVVDWDETLRALSAELRDMQAAGEGSGDGVPPTRPAGERTS